MSNFRSCSVKTVIVRVHAHVRVRVHVLCFRPHPWQCPCPSNMDLGMVYYWMCPCLCPCPCLIEKWWSNLVSVCTSMNQTSTKGSPTLIFLHVKIFNVLILNDWLNFEHLTSIYIYMTYKKLNIKHTNLKITFWTMLQQLFNFQITHRNSFSIQTIITCFNAIESVEFEAIFKISISCL